MLFILCNEITIGGKRFHGLNHVKIKHSVHDLAATATIKIPVTAVLKQKGQPATATHMAQAIKIGDEVIIRLGYNGNLNTEFSGFVKQLNNKTPFEIVCEDMFYQCRRKSVTLEGENTLAGVLQACGLKQGSVANLTFDSFAIPNQSVASVLSKIKNDYNLAVFFGEGKINAFKPFPEKGETVKYLLRGNIVKDDDLKYQETENAKIKITAISVGLDGEELKVEKGDKNGVEKILRLYNVKDSEELEKLAENELQRSTYGYSGKIETFLLPYAAPGMVAEMTDTAYPERNGSYYIESVETTFGTSGARRSIEIGQKI